MNDVPHNWAPSTRLRKLMQRTGFVVADSHTREMPQLAHVWLDRHRALFEKPADAQRSITIVRYHLRDTTIDELREMVALSYIEQDRVVGALVTTRNLGVKTFAALRAALRVS